MSSPTVRVRLHRTLVVLLLAVPLSQALSAGPAHAAAAFAAQGSVTDALGEPLPGVTVTAVSVPGGATAATDNTDADGGYELVELAVGDYHVTFSKAGYTSATYDGFEPVLVTVESDGSVSVDGEPVDDNTLDDVELVSSAFSVTGIVQAASNGQPVAGITVRAFPEGATDPQELVDTETTSGSGGYTLDLPVGAYDIQLVDQDPSAPSYISTWIGGASPTTVEVGQGGVLTVGGTPVATLPTVLMAVPTATTTYDVTGQVVDANFDPIDGVVATAVPVGPTPASQQVSVTTGADGAAGAHGRYRLPLLPGTYQIQYDGGSHFADASYPGNSAPAVDVVVQSGGTVLADGAEAVGGELNALGLVGVTGYSLGGKAVSSASVGISGITVDVYSEDDVDPDALVATTTTGAGGAYGFSALTVGTYVLQFSDELSDGTTYVQTWFGGATASPVKVGQSGAVSVDDVPAPGAVLTDTVLQVANTDTTYPLTGEVVDANYYGLPGVTVTAVAKPGGAVSVVATSGPDGSFRLDVKAGTYEVAYAKSGYPTVYYLDPDRDDGARAQVVVAVGGTIRIGGYVVTGGELDSQEMVSSTKHTVSGTVVDESSAGLSGITVEVLSAYGVSVVATATSGAGGFYTFQLPVGSYNIRFVDNVVASPTYAVAWLGGDPPKVVMVATGGQVSLDDVAVTTPLAPVTMTQATGDTTYDLKGLAYNERYRPLNGATVEVRPVAGTPSSQAAAGSTGADPQHGAGSLGNAGVYRIPVLPGRYQLRFTAPGLETTYLTNYDDLTQPVTVTVAPNGVITGPGLDMTGGVLDDVQLLLPAPALVTAPRLTGKLVVGSTVTTTVGVWSPAITGDYKSYSTVEWFIDGKPSPYGAGAFNQKFAVPAVAATRKLSYRLTIEDPDGYRAPAVFTSAPVQVPKAPSSVAATLIRRRIRVTVSVPTLKTPTGAIIVREGKKKVGKAKLVAAAKGVVVIDVSKLKHGRHKLTITYAGSATVAATKKVLKIKV